MARFTWFLVGLLMCGGAAEGCGTTAGGPDGNEPPGAETIASLRARGPEGLDEALQIYNGLVQEQARLSLVCAGQPDDQLAEIDRNLDAWRTAIDAIGGQRSCTVSRLYWYTDLEEAKAAAERSGRPILSLRMLGKLTDEFSCANSRFFRTALYSNKEVSDYLRENFILHWQSVRPVPRVTIDFGDGRKLERTITGNSAHYIVTRDGTPLDVLPGLYSPAAFREWLERMSTLHTEYLAAYESGRRELLAAFHRQRRAEVYRQWSGDIERLGAVQADLVRSRIDGAIELASKAGNDPPVAAAAARMAETKTAAESPLLRFASFSGPWIERGMDDQLWQAVAGLHRNEVKLDEASVEIVRREFPAAEAMRLSMSKARQEDPVLRLVQSFENSIAVDTVRNEYQLHRQIHEQFADGAAVTENFDALNEWVYAQLFLTPSSDPWLGLAPNDIYTALENDGRVERTNGVELRAGG